MIIENRYINYLVPIKIIDQKGDINNIDALFLENDNQISIYEPQCLEINGKGFIVLDFGEEIAGGIRILMNMAQSETQLYNLRIRFGESVAETYSNINDNGSTNNHSMRDMIVQTPALSDQSFGDTGFRFVRIDFLDNTIYRIKNIFAKSWFNNLTQKEHFRCSDNKLNQIFDTSKHTLDLCIQNTLIDGIKRDRLVWIGDMEPEVRGILHLYGNIDQIEKSLNIAEMHNPQPCWMGGIPSYSIWYLMILAEILEYTNDLTFYNRHKKYADNVLYLLKQAINTDGTLDYLNVKESPSECYFIDWPSSDEDKQGRIDANKNLLIFVLRKYISVLSKYDFKLKNEKEMLSLLQSKPTKISSCSQFAAFHYLVNKDNESYQTLIRNGARGMSTFSSYYILTAIADRNFVQALTILKEYYGAMLERGATTFWEDFSIDWLENSNQLDDIPSNDKLNLHGDFGKYCYIGFRLSLCHGWSCGPIAFLLENKDKIV